LGIGDWGLGIGDWAQSPIPNPQSPFTSYNIIHFKNINKKKLIKYLSYIINLILIN